MAIGGVVSSRFRIIEPARDPLGGVPDDPRAHRRQGRGFTCRAANHQSVIPRRSANHQLRGVVIHAVFVERGNKWVRSLKYRFSMVLSSRHKKIKQPTESAALHKPRQKSVRRRRGIDGLIIKKIALSRSATVGNSCLSPSNRSQYGLTSAPSPFAPPTALQGFFRRVTH